jgi:hypothetical protein
MAGDKGFKKSEGMNQEDEMDNERGKTEIGDQGDHGWAPDSGTGHSSGKPDAERTGETATDQRTK